MTIGHRIEMLRKKHGLTREQFGEHVDIHPQTLYRYEKDARNIDATKVCKIADYFNISTDWIISGKDSMHISVATQLKGAVQEQQPTLEAPRKGLRVQCAELKKELLEERLERRELAKENRQLWKESAELRERTARLETNLQEIIKNG